MRAQSKPASRVTYLLIGNPGVGKSTILNGFLGRAVFKSGLSFGSGMTYQLDKYEDEASGCTFADTPGLADTEKRAQAAAAITQALRMGGRFRIFFVITLEQGRVKPEDCATLKLVLDAAPVTSYGIIINQANPKEHRELLDNPSNRSPSPCDMVLQQLLARLRPEQRSLSVHIMLRDTDLDGGDDMVKQLPKDLRCFMAGLPGMEIAPEAVSQVREDEFAQEKEESACRIKDLVEANQSMKDALKMTEAEMAGLRAQVDEHRKGVVVLQSKMEEQGEQHRCDVEAMEARAKAAAEKHTEDLLRLQQESECRLKELGAQHRVQMQQLQGQLQEQRKATERHEHAVREVKERHGHDMSKLREEHDRAEKRHAEEMARVRDRGGLGRFLFDAFSVLVFPVGFARAVAGDAPFSR